MHIEHIAIWTDDLEKTREFYARYFGANFGRKYENPAKGFSSYFMTFEDGARLELMYKDTITQGHPDQDGEQLGYAHRLFR